MVKSMRITNLPTNKPANHHQKLPPKRIEPATATSAQTAILYLVFIFAVFLSLCGFKRWGSWVSIIFLSVSRLSDVFFMRFSVGSVVFVSGAQKGVGFRTNKVYEKKYSPDEVRQEDFFQNRLRLDLVCAWRTRKYLCHLNENDWSDRLRLIQNGGKRIKRQI